MAGVQYNKAKKKYFARIQVGGVRKRFWFAGSKRKAEEALVDLKRRIAAGEVPFTEETSTSAITVDGRKDILLSELAHHHLGWVQAHRSPRSYQLRKFYLKRFLAYCGDTAMVSQVTRQLLGQYHTWAKTNYSLVEGGGNENLRHVKTFLLWGEEEGYYELAFRKFPAITEPRQKTKRVSEEDLRVFLGKADDDLRDLVLFGLLTGLRPQELRELTWSGIRQDGQGRSYIHIQNHKTARSARTPMPRTVPLCEAAAEIAERQQQKHPDSDHVFLHHAGVPYMRQILRNRMIRCCKQAKIPAITPYALRHSFASMEVEAGVSQFSLASLMGHTTVRTTARYVSNTFEHHRSAVDKVADRLRVLVPKEAPEEKLRKGMATPIALLVNGADLKVI